MKKFLVIAASVLVLNATAQDSASHASPVSFSAFAEVYYSYDFSKPADNKRPFFLYNHNRHNEFNVNLGFVKAGYQTENIRANLALAAGTYVNANYAAEPGVLKNLYEANIGAKILKSKKLWIDAGIFASHLGFESAQSSNSPTLTRSIIADNSPYYEAGVKLNYTSDNTKWYFSILALNGWQRIQRLAGNSLMCWGNQITFTPSSKASFNYSSFLGSDSPDSARMFRIFHDLYTVLQLTSKWQLIVCFDIGQQQASKGSSSFNTWYGTSVILHYAFTKDWAAAARGEYYHDETGIIIYTGTPNGFKTSGFSLNVDRNIGDHFLWRTEVRIFNSEDNIFPKSGSYVDNNTAITTSFAFIL
jgi:hypothetical protein